MTTQSLTPVIRKDSDHGYEQGALLYFSSGENEMVAIVREKAILRMAINEGWSVEKLLNQGYVGMDIHAAYDAAKGIEELIPTE